MKWQKIANQKKQDTKKAAAAGGEEAKKDGDAPAAKADDGWDPNADMASMTMAQ